MTDTKISEQKRLQKLAKKLGKEHNEKADLLVLKMKKLLGTSKRIVKLKEPVALLMRSWGAIEVHEGVTDSEWAIPPGKDQSKEDIKRVVHLTKQSQYDLQYGNDSLKVYIINENDAMPVGADAKVWSEGIYHKLQSILINIHKLQDQLSTNRAKAIKDLLLYGALGIGVIIVAYTLYKMLAPASPPTIIKQVAETVVPVSGKAIQNITGGFQ